MNSKSYKTKKVYEKWWYAYLSREFVTYEKAILDLYRAHKVIIAVGVHKVLRLWYAYTSGQELLSPLENCSFFPIRYLSRLLKLAAI